MILCKVCGKKLDRRSKSGLCKPHFMWHLNNDPTIRDRQREAVLEWSRSNPEAVRARSVKIWKARKADAAGMAAQAERMRTIVQPASTTPEAVARRDLKERAKAISRAKLPWCPDEYRAEYRRLVMNSRFKAHEAKAVIMQQVEADRKRAKPKPENLSPFERQERALKAGATLQDNAPITRWSPAADELRKKLG